MRLLPLSLIALSACAPQADVSRASGDVLAVEYLGVEARSRHEDLVTLVVKMRGAQTGEDVTEYGACVAAQYALEQGYNFARHVRTNVEIEAGVWRGDAVYTISATLPRGLRTIDAEVTVANCEENGIPTV